MGLSSLEETWISLSTLFLNLLSKYEGLKDYLKCTKVRSIGMVSPLTAAFSH